MKSGPYRNSRDDYHRGLREAERILEWHLQQISLDEFIAFLRAEGAQLPEEPAK